MSFDVESLYLANFYRSPDAGGPVAADHIDFNGARIRPRCLRLVNAWHGKEFSETISIQNVGSETITIKTMDPNNDTFSVSPTIKKFTISSGLSHYLKVKHTYSILNQIKNCWIPIFVNECNIPYPVIVEVSAAEVYSEPRSIDFGRINSTHHIKSKTIQLYNKGSKTSNFEIKLSSEEMDLIVHPQKGVIPPNASVYLNVQFVGTKEGVFAKEIWVKCNALFQIPVSVNVITPMLTSPSPGIENMYWIVKFKPTYGRSTSTTAFKFTNVNTENAMFVILPDSKTVNLNSKYFTLDPNQGVIKADEMKTIKLTFHPTHTNKKQSYSMPYQIFRVDCTKVEEQKEVEMSKFKCTELNESNSLLLPDDSIMLFEHSQHKIYSSIKAHNFIYLFLYGIVHPVEVKLVPNEFYLDPMVINSKCTRFIEIHNMSRDLPIHFRYKKAAFVDVEPASGIVTPSGSTKASLIVHSRAQGSYKANVTIDLLFPNQSDICQPSEPCKVGSVTAIVYFSSRLAPCVLKNKFAPGITPLVANEVGFVHDVKFSDRCEKPRNAMAKLENDDALIAFPNDRSRSLRPWTNKHVCKTICKKMPRIVTETDEYMLSAVEKDKKIINNERYKIRKNDHYEHALIDIDDDMEEMVLNNLVTGAKGESKNHKLTKVLSLTPMNLNCIKVIPKVINAEMIALNSTAHCHVVVQNNNEFPISMKFKTKQVPYLLFKSLAQATEVPARSETKVSFQVSAFALGLHTTIINAIVNNEYNVTLVFRAYVVTPFVTFDKYKLSIDLLAVGMSEELTIMNSLNVPVKFKWTYSAGSCFSIDPVDGEIPSKKSIISTVYFNPCLFAWMSSKLMINCENGNCRSLLVTSLLQPKPDVRIEQDVIKFDNLPLNIEEKWSTILYNYSHELVTYSIRNPTPLPGIEVFPDEGFIPRRSFKAINIKLRMKAFAEFKVNVEIEIYMQKNLTLTICGRVAFPEIKFSPARLVLKRIVTESIDIVPFAVQNTSGAKVHLTYLKDLYPEVQISRDEMSFVNDRDIVLDPGEKISLNLHYSPLDVCMNEFYLPIVINNMLGPPCFERNESLQIGTYVHKYSDVPKLIIVENNTRKFRSLAVRVIATRPILQFSRLSFHFKHADAPMEMSIKNVHDLSVQFCIRIDDMHPNFNITHAGDKRFEYKDKAISMELQPGDEIKLQIEFSPANPGNYELWLPIFVNKYNHCKLFNYLHLCGTYPAPRFASAPCIYLEPTPLKTTLVRAFKIKSSHHLRNCRIQCGPTIPHICIEMSDKQSISPEHWEHSVALRFTPLRPEAIRTELAFCCTCRAKHKVRVVGCGDYCIFTTYAFKYLTDFSLSRNVHERKPDSAFPAFARAEDKEFYGYMKRIVLIAERWVFGQTGGTCYYTVPKGFSRCVDLKSDSHDICNKKKYPFVIILSNVLEQTNLEPITTGQLPSEKHARISALRTMYSLLIDLLETQDAVLPCVNTKFLLSYDEYVTHEKEMKNRRPLPYDDFTRSSYQCWTDLLLQTAKTAILNGMRYIKLQSSSFDSNPSTFSAEPFVNAEQTLLEWLSAKYNSNLSALQELDTGFPLAPKKISSFSHLRDSLAFVAATIDHCPYLRGCLDNIFIQVDNRAKALHNASRLIAVWQQINLNFGITPANIVDACPVQMMMIASHAYQVFPFLSPQSQIDFTADLSCTAEEEIEIGNPTAKPVLYNVLFLDNEADSFEVDGDCVRVPPRRTVKVKVSYRAKSIYVVQATVIFSKDSRTQFPAKCHVYTLNGSPCFTKEAMHIQCRVPLYAGQKKTIEISSPYKCAASYKMFFCFTIGEESLVLIPFEHTGHKHPRLLFTRSSEFTTDERGDGAIDVYAVCLAPEQDVHVFFLGARAGDFFVRFSVSAKSGPPQEVPLRARVPPPCVRDECPRSVRVQVPRRNRRLDACLVKMFLLQVNTAAAPVWQSYFDSELGKDLMRWFVNDDPTVVSKATLHLLRKTITYDISTTTPGVRAPSSICIDVDPAGTASIPVHIDDTVSKCFDLTLTAEQGVERRLYRVLLTDD